MLPVFLRSQGTFWRRVLPPKIIASIGIAVPNEYANVIRIALPLTEFVAARVITDAIIGPTHGVHTNPKLTPRISPPKNPEPFGRLETLEASFVKSFSIRIWKLGRRRLTPNKRIMITDKFLKTSADIPVNLTIAERKSVNKEKLSTKPVTIPNGLLCPPVKDPDKTTGKIGRIQGERIVTKPARNEKAMSKIIYTISS